MPGFHAGAECSQMPQMEIRTIAGRLAPARRPGQSTFEHCFEHVFPALRECWFVVDELRPGDLHPKQRELLSRYRVAGVDVGPRVIDIYRGKRFLATFGFAVPSSFGRVFAFAKPPDEATLRSTTDGYPINARKLAPAAVASFVAFEGTWTFATPDPNVMEALRTGLPAGLELAETPRSLNFLDVA